MRTLLVLLLLVSIQSFTKSQGRLLIKSGFEENISLEHLRGGSVFTGTDSKTGFSWDAHGLPGTLKFFYLSGDAPDNYVSTRIDNVDGPHSTPSRALYMEVKKDFQDRFGMVSRNEFSYFTDAAFSEGYVTYWMKLQEDYLDLAPKTIKSEQLDYYQLDSWRMLMELKEPNSGVSIKGRGTNNYRISFFIARDSLSNTMYWLLRGEMPQPVRAIDWSMENRSVDVPVGEWFKMEVYYKKGRENGRVWWAMNGKVIADYMGRTEHPDNPMPIKFWSFFKLYQDEKWFEKGPVYQWIDDLEYWSSYPPGHEVLDPEQHQILYRDNFQREQELKDSDYWTEGSSKVKIENGHLLMDANPDGSGEDQEACTVWLNRKFSGDVRVDYDARVILSEGQKNNINFFFMYSHPEGTRLTDTAGERADGSYTRYHDLNGYIFTFLANGNPDKARIRLRDNPDFHLLSEQNKYHCKEGRTYHITILKKGALLTYMVDGEVMLQHKDREENPVHEKGYVGFRTWKTELQIDNLVISKI